jgi:hypothetical protein
MSPGQNDREWPAAHATGRPSIRDHVSDVPVRARLAANRVHVAASNAWYRAAGRRIHGARQGISNARNQRTLERGRRPRTTQAADVLRSSVPFYRNRINRGTGQPHRADRDLGRVADSSLARMAPGVRAASNQRHVRATLAAKQPQVARTLEATVRELSPRRPRPALRFVHVARKPGPRAGRTP